MKAKRITLLPLNYTRLYDILSYVELTLQVDIYQKLKLIFNFLCVYLNKYILLSCIEYFS
jgi:hypothetical protein